MRVISFGIVVAQALPLQGSFGSFGPKVTKRVRNELPAPLGPGKSRPKRSVKQLKNWQTSGRAKGAAKASCGETVVQKGVSKSCGKIAGKTFVSREMPQILGVSGTGKGEPAANLGSTLPGPSNQQFQPSRAFLLKSLAIWASKTLLQTPEHWLHLECYVAPRLVLSLKYSTRVSPNRTR